MNRHYQQFGQGLCMRGNERPTIPTTGGSWGANPDFANLSARHWLIPRDMNRPSIRTAFGLSTEQRAYNNIIHPTSRSSFNAGLTGTGGIYGANGHGIRVPTNGIYGANGAGIRQLNIDGTIFGPTGRGTGGIVGANGHGIRIPTNGMIVGANGHGIRRVTGGLNKRKKSKKSRRRRSKRRTGGYYEDIRRAINKASTSGLCKRKRKSSRRSRKGKR